MRSLFSKLILAILLLVTTNTFSQKVGLVLSGGAAKGIAHVGVLKALEEHEIPIDYITGTSMGGIVGGCYAAGMSPDQIEDIILSKEFLQWVNGKLEAGYNYYYFKNEDDASFLRLNLSLDSTFNVFFNSYIANDLSLNFALAEILAQPSASAKNNFDSLFVPLRVMASDIFTQQQVILSKGSLSDAIRATQTVPFFYNPIRIDGRYLFDGGVYNNFPVDVMQNTFHPEVIIGSNVSSKVFDEYPYGKDDELISRSLLYMMLDKSDPSDIPTNGVYIQPNIVGYTSFDFAKAKALIDSGYQQTIRQMDDIKQKVKERRSCETVAEARNQFNNKTRPLVIDNIVLDGFNSRQRRYINRFFKSGKRPLYFNDVKSGYYRLVSEDYFNNIYPSFRTNENNRFDFYLARRKPNNFKVDFGGVIASRSISNIFLGLNYYYFNRALTHANASFFAGNFYKSALVKARINIPNMGQFYIEPETIFNSWDYLEGKDIVVTKSTPTVLSRIDRKMGVNIGIPIGQQFKAVISSAYVRNSDQYINTEILSSTDTLDVLKLRGIRTGIAFSSNTLNRKQYPSLGRKYEISATYFHLNEELDPGNTSVLAAIDKKSRQWFRAKVTLEEYFRKGVYSSGYLVEGVFSNQPAFLNYFGSLINAPAFNPLQDSRTLLLQNFRAYNYVAGGWRNVFTLRKSLDLRLEGYLFKPFEALLQDEQQNVRLNDDIRNLYFIGTAGLVLHSSVGPISLSMNYYDDKENQLGVLLHVGFLLFHKTSID